MRAEGLEPQDLSVTRTSPRAFAVSPDANPEQAEGPRVLSPDGRHRLCTKTGIKGESRHQAVVVRCGGERGLIDGVTCGWSQLKGAQIVSFATLVYMVMAYVVAAERGVCPVAALAILSRSWRRLPPPWFERDRRPRRPAPASFPRPADLITCPSRSS